jgi:hypothetical protein
LTLPQPKATSNFSKVFTLKVRTGELAGNKVFWLWFFLSWGIDNRIKSLKTKFGKIASWIFNHPISHCVLEPTKVKNCNKLEEFIKKIKKWRENLCLSH